jgi:hypothetical protein
MGLRSCSSADRCNAGSIRKWLLFLPVLLLLQKAASGQELDDGVVPGKASDGVVIAQADLQGLQAVQQSLVDARGFLRG